ncbi:hypothetical protein PRIPAC_85093 [Pristionchus pacificus]|uniref:Uncharacterized protein n=1 Tax=Pristionchus pacificus TaxID=54126 RepID=A0A2A6BV10_PRIPA|nr:hypothetical protein PRIPAC_85093 [Pristionchus pacificus]|eukprot:PDM69739.1 hypothetical protein PRIPAC_44835 [Pristionchus pacificus]
MQLPALTRKRLEKYRAYFHDLLRISGLYSGQEDRRLLLALIDVYYREERSEPLLSMDRMTDYDKTIIRQFFISTMCLLFDETQWIGDSNIRQLISGYTLFRTEVYPIAQKILGDSLGVYHRGMLLLAEFRLRYWAFGPNLGKESGSITSGAEWWQKSREITPEMHNVSIRSAMKDINRIKQEYTLSD